MSSFKVNLQMSGQLLPSYCCVKQLDGRTIHLSKYLSKIILSPTKTLLNMNLSMSIQMCSMVYLACLLTAQEFLQPRAKRTEQVYQATLGSKGTV